MPPRGSGVGGRPPGRFGGAGPHGRKPADRGLAGLRSAVTTERREAQRGLDLRLAEVVETPQPRVFVVRIERQPGLVVSEDAEGGTMTRLDPPEGWIASIEVVDPRHDLLTIETRTDVRPRPGERVRVQAPDFLQFLDNWAKGIESLPSGYLALTEGRWGDAKWNERSGEALEQPPTLRPAQKTALDNAEQRASVVWGPPGTGKTFTLGAVVAGHLRAGRSVLVVSTTNVAVDQATLAIDDACLALGASPGDGVVVRVGRPKLRALEERRHLLRWTEVLRRIAEAKDALAETHRELRRKIEQTPRTDPSWPTLKAREAELAGQLRGLEERRSRELAAVAHEARVITCTLTSFCASALVHDKTYDVLAIDEASMISRAAVARALALEFRSVVVAGDPRQLPPVAVSQGPDADYWLRQSAFEALGFGTGAENRLRDRSALTFLAQQSRMQPEICDPIGNSFYEGRLLTVGTPPTPPDLPGWPCRGIVVIDPRTCPLPPDTRRDLTLAPQRDGTSWVWDRSAIVTLSLAQQLAARRLAPDSLLVLSPFRPQVRLLARLAPAFDGAELPIRTVHQSQGTEAHTVLIDLVAPNSWFIRDSDMAARLLNVAFSRARAQVFVIGDPDAIANNPYLARLCRDAEQWQPGLQ